MPLTGVSGMGTEHGIEGGIFVEIGYAGAIAQGLEPGRQHGGVQGGFLIQLSP